MRIISAIQQLTFVIFLYLKDLDADTNIGLQLTNHFLKHGSFRRMHETIVPCWMLYRPQSIVPLMVFIKDNSGIYYEGTIPGVYNRNGADDQTDPAVTPMHAKIRFKTENWEADQFQPHNRPKINLRRMVMSNPVPPLPDRNMIYIMMLNGKIHSSIMTFKETVLEGEPFDNVMVDGTPVAYQIVNGIRGPIQIADGRPAIFHDNPPICYPPEHVHHGYF